MLAYAEQITRDASQITEANIQRLRDVGFTDVNIADIALAASFRSFMSRYFDAVGATVSLSFSMTIQRSEKKWQSVENSTQMG